MLGSLQLIVFNELKKRNKVTVYKNEDFSVLSYPLQSKDESYEFLMDVHMQTLQTHSLHTWNGMSFKSRVIEWIQWWDKSLGGIGYFKRAHH